MSKDKSVLFVCMGNICRSPTGEGVLQKLVADRGLADRYFIDSAGTIGYHAGERADRRMREAASHRGYALESRARQFLPDDFERFDLIVAMDRSNLADIEAQDRSSKYAPKIKLLSEFLSGGDWPKDVPDPYYGGPAGFEKVLDMIEAAAESIIEHLES